MKRYSYIGFYLVFTGIGIIVLLLQTFLTRETAQQSIGELFYLFSESLTAALCIVSGFLLVSKKTGGRRLSLFSLGMMLYSLINRLEYYWETSNMKLLVLFAALIIFSLISLVILLKDKRYAITYKGSVPHGFSDDE